MENLAESSACASCGVPVGSPKHHTACRKGQVEEAGKSMPESAGIIEGN